MSKKNILIRGVDAQIALALSVIAAQNAMSRENFIRDLLMQAVKDCRDSDPIRYKKGMWSARLRFGSAKIEPPNDLI